MLQVTQIQKSFSDKEVIHNVGFEIGQKETVSIMGKSGSGKSTLLSIVAGLVRPDSGEILFDGQSLNALDEEELASFRLHNIGFIFQDFKLIPSLTIHDNILLGIYPRKDIADDEKERRIVQLSEEVGLAGRLDERIDTLSGGEKQRVAIARSLAGHPPLVLADEPTGNLDSRTAEEIMALFAQLHDRHQTSFLIVTHDRDIASQTQHTLTMKDGELQS